MEKLDDTESICPGCLKDGEVKKIPAQIVEEDGKVWIKKECPEHGSFKSIIFSDVNLYKRWMKYKVSGEGPEYHSFNGEVKKIDPLPFSDVSLYPKHLSQTVLTNLLVTNRCNLRCSYCFMNAGAAGYVYEPSLEKLKKMMEQVRDEKPVPSKAIQITGGEPTVRDDLFEIIKIAKDLGFVHIQLNSNGIKMGDSVEYCKKLKEAGVKTIYLSFDGVSKKTNPWIEQNKKAIENCREAGITSIILVPVLINGKNMHEAPDIVKFAVNNSDVVAGVNFQPLACAGRPRTLRSKDREKQRVDYAQMLKELEKGFDGQIKMDDFYPVPFVYPLSKLIETFKGEKQVEFTANPQCGGATYVFIDDDGNVVPITRFLDVEAFVKFADNLSKTKGRMKKAKIIASFIKNLGKFIDKEKVPEGLSIKKLIAEALTKGDYDALGKFHRRSLYIGSMWFQDAWNLNLERLKRCVIHYATPEGVVPFCTYNGIGVGDKIREKHSIPIKEWEEKTGKKMKDDLWKNGPVSDVVNG